jgi:hypothetical protein
MARLVLLLAVLVIVPAALAAQDVFVIQTDKLDMAKLTDDDYIHDNLSAATQYIRIDCALGGSKQVSLKVVRADTGDVVLDKNYGQVSGSFKSGEIYLKYSGSTTIKYNITLTAGNTTYEFPFYRRLMALKNNTACTFGVRIKQLNSHLTDAWTMATPLDLTEIAALPGGVKRINLCASNMYIIGSVSVRVRDGILRVSMQLDGESDSYVINDQNLFLITSPSDWDSVDPKRLTEHEFEIGTDIVLQDSLKDVQYVVLYLPVKLTYEPNGMSRFGYDLQNDPELIRETEIWDAMKDLDAKASVG